MCTAISFKAKDFYFGRNLDLDRSYGEEVCVMPRNFPLKFSTMGEMNNHFAIIGMATVVSGIPLFYDGANEHGLAMAGLNFPGNAYYAPIRQDKDNIAPFEFITWILSRCKTVNEATELLNKINLANIPFSEQLPPSPLHWIISDKNHCIVVEFMKDGLHLHENIAGILTNNPPFEYHLENLKKYRQLKIDNSNVTLRENDGYTSYCQGLGAVGLPGDVSSMSRFVRAAFNKENSVCPEDEKSAVGQFFHLLTSVEFVKGACLTDEGHWDITVYSSCINASKGQYYYTTYRNRRISCVDMHKTYLEGADIYRFPLKDEESIDYRN